MPWYRCFIRGENFPGSLTASGSDAVGFFTTRWIEVRTPGEAEQCVLDLLRKDPKLSLPKDGPKPTSAKVYVEEVVPCRARRTNGSGFTWFDMDDSEAEADARQLERDANWR